MGDRHIFVGLGEYAIRMAKEVASFVPNSKYFGIDEWVYAPVEHSHAIYARGMKMEDYYSSLCPEIRNWNQNRMGYFTKCNVTYWSRSDIRMIYEWRARKLINEKKLDNILCKELSDLSDKDQIHLIVPSCDRVALSIAFFVGWDIKEYYKQYNLNVSVFANVVLPDTMIYNFGSMVELHYDYAISCAFMKELICITEICNGTLHDNTDLSCEDFNLSHWFNGKCDYGCIEKLPFDGVSFVGCKEVIDLKDRELHEQIRNELTDEIINCINNPEEAVISCVSERFMDDLYNKCPIYSPVGRAAESYTEFHKERKRWDDSLHLDWRWDELLINI